MNKPLEILSLGAGVQSSTMALMYKHGDLSPMPDAAVFADTHGEPKAVYAWLDWLSTQLPFPVIKASKGDLWKSATTIRRTRDGLRTYIPTGIPVFMIDGLKKGIGKRQCTRDFKIDVITKEIKKLAGVYRATKASGIIARMHIGISLDEVQRVKPSAKAYIQCTWPLIEKQMTRMDCFIWMETHGYPRPPRSACTYCPYHDDKSWLSLTDDEFADAVRKEKELQAAYAATTEIKGTPFFHASRVPLDQVLFDESRSDDDEQGLAVECEGMCGV